MKPLKLFASAIAVTFFLLMPGCGDNAPMDPEDQPILPDHEGDTLFFSCNPPEIPENPPHINDFYATLPYVPPGFKLVKRLEYGKSTADSSNNGIKYYYNNSGNLVKEEIYSHYDRYQSFPLFTYEYSDDNKVVKRATYMGEEGNYTEAQYDAYTYEGRRLVRQETFRGNPYYITYEYKGNTVLKRFFSPDPTGSMNENLLKYTYNDQGKISLFETSTTYPNDLKYRKWIYDDQGREIKIEDYNVDWTLRTYTVNSYEGNTIVEQKIYDGNDQLLSKITYRLDQWGNQIEKILNDAHTVFKRKYEGQLFLEAINYSSEWGYVESGMIRLEYKPTAIR
ncbi:MAG: hypothetical protein LBC81_00185 [Tannerellaceae bacterium]|jgi:hypothetical protein|nr:hypothetical protein [Tannerellaceae bacterium]